MDLNLNDSADSAYPHMGEKKPPLSDSAALAEAMRCLYCFDAPCIKSCPTGIDVPAFIKKISTGNIVGAAKTILSSNILGASCARVCPTEVLCEGACVLGTDYEPIAIGKLQRHATDYVMQRRIPVLHPPAVPTGYRIAVIGGGPAGLGCAANLALLGHQVTIFEKNPLAGGLNTYGIAYYKMKPQVSLEEVELVKSLGVEIRTGISVGQDISPQDIFATHAAVFVGIGLGSGKKLGIPGEEGAGVRDALDFIRDIHEFPLNQVDVGRRVLVLGGGNTAIDAAVQAKRLGAEFATVAYRRSEEEMSAYRFEIAAAKGDGCHFLFHAMPREILREADGAVCGVSFLDPQKNTDWIEPCDQLLLAIGQPKQTTLINQLFPGIAIDEAGRVLVDPSTGETSIPKVFAGGDCVNGGKEVVNAVGEGTKAARGIHQMLTGVRMEFSRQSSRVGISGHPSGAGILNPIRVKES